MTHQILLTGATGFVGRKILDALLSQEDVKVKIISRNSNNQHLASNPKVEIITTNDLFNENLEWLIQTCDSVDTVIHAAWYTEPSMYLNSSNNLDCLIGTLKLAHACIKANVTHFIGIGSCSEYDPSAGYLNTNNPLKPTSLYAATKVATFLTLSSLFSSNQIKFCWARIFYLFGDGEDSRRFIPYLRKQLASGLPVELTRGTQIRDFLDVREAGKQIAKLAEKRKEGPVNICSGVPQTIREIAERIADEYNRRDLLLFGIRAENLFDPPCVVGIKEDLTQY